MFSIPSTRAAAIVTSDTTVERDPFYSGNVINEKSTIVSRVAENFFRFGSFEIFKEKEDPDDPHDRAGTANNFIASRILHCSKTRNFIILIFPGPSAGNSQLKQQLLDHILLFYPSVSESLPPREKYAAFMREITERTASLVASWMTVGWVHGVLNTDNMSIMGLTIGKPKLL